MRNLSLASAFLLVALLFALTSLPLTAADTAEKPVTGSVKVKMTPAQKRTITDIRKKYRELRKELTAKEDAEIDAVLNPPKPAGPAKEPGK